MAKHNSWSEKLRRAREEKGLAQGELASRLGTNQQNISRWEQGITKPSPYYRQRLSEVLGKSLEELGFLETMKETMPESEHIESERQEFPPPQMPESGQRYRPTHTPSIAKTAKPFLNSVKF